MNIAYIDIYRIVIKGKYLSGISKAFNKVCVCEKMARGQLCDLQFLSIAGGLIMAQYEEVYEELKGRTGTDPEVEKELCKRVAEIETQGEVVPGLTKGDWILSWVLIALGTFLPIVVYACKLGISG